MTLGRSDPPSFSSYPSQVGRQSNDFLTKPLLPLAAAPTSATLLKVVVVGLEDELSLPAKQSQPPAAAKRAQEGSRAGPPAAAVRHQRGGHVVSALASGIPSVPTVGMIPLLASSDDETRLRIPSLRTEPVSDSGQASLTLTCRPQPTAYQCPNRARPGACRPRIGSADWHGGPSC